MKRHALFAAIVFLSLLLAVPAPLGASSLSTTTLITPGLDGTGANGRFLMANGRSLSHDGHITVFATQSTNIILGDTNNAGDVFAYDRTSGKTELISKNVHGQSANAASMYPTVSADGRFVAYLSSATDIVPEVKSPCPQPNQCGMVFVYDRVAKQHSVASRSANGNVLPVYYYDSPSISGDGLSVVFAARVPTPSGVTENLYTRHLPTATTRPISVDNSGKLVRTFGGEPSLSYDGRYATFTTAEQIASGDTNEVNDVYLRDTHANTTTLISRAAHGASIAGNSSSSGGIISSDGRFVAFQSFASDLVASDTRGYRDVFLRDLATGKTQRISISNQGEQGNFGSYDPDITDDGRFVVYTTEANNLVPADTNSKPDILLYDRFAQITRRINVASGRGVQADEYSEIPSISGNGKTIQFRSWAHNLVPNGANLLTNNLYLRHNPVVYIPFYDPEDIIDILGQK
ncbi:MAG TPA: hypothetical protein VFO38_03070 [Candidatus Saccharimonadales bacterium]|nr:hypothetical protein [Candidatus Saccharimonadales bacterium]